MIFVNLWIEKYFLSGTEKIPKTPAKEILATLACLLICVCIEHVL